MFPCYHSASSTISLCLMSFILFSEFSFLSLVFKIPSLLYAKKIARRLDNATHRVAFLRGIWTINQPTNSHYRQQKLNKANSKIHVCYDLLPLGGLIIAITLSHKSALAYRVISKAQSFVCSFIPLIKKIITSLLPFAYPCIVPQQIGFCQRAFLCNDSCSLCSRNSVQNLQMQALLACHL